jgi:lactate dehydrogenase-like 2-hydroxyacid dehydrogenase
MADTIRILLTRRWPDQVESALRARYEVVVDPDDRKLTADELREAMRAFDILCPTVTDRIDASILSVPDRRVRLIANYGAGVDHIDLAAARAAGLPVSNTPDVLTEATAELAVLLMMMVSRRAGEGERELRAGAWAGWRPTHLLGRSLRGKTLGLVGFGRIGQATARLASQALGVRIAYHGRRRAPAEIEAETGAVYVDTLGKLAAAVDVLSLHCPGGADNRHMIDRALLAKMKPGAILINTARGPLVNETDLAEAINSGHIWGAGLDVHEHEPAITEALLTLPNVVLLPHLGSADIETRTAMGMRALANVEHFLASGDLLDRVV